MEELQKAIKVEVPDHFATVAARKIELYQVNLDGDEEINIKNNFEAITHKESDAPRLRPSHRLSK